MTCMIKMDEFSTQTYRFAEAVMQYKLEWKEHLITELLGLPLD